MKFQCIRGIKCISNWILLLLLLLKTTINAEIIKCGDGLKCPEHKPCCSQYGECGTGLHCLNACIVQDSFNLTSCAPLPICKPQKYHFKTANLKDNTIINQKEYFGDATKHSWTTNGEVLQHKGALLLTMSKNSFGTVLSSTRAVWYGNIKATLKTSHGSGVVGAFILMSGTKDEIDWEFIGYKLNAAETNYYYQGVLDYTKGKNIEAPAIHEQYHTYEIDWTPDQITWKLDGRVGRVLKREDTYNPETDEYMFPQTPAIVQLSLWPGGSPLNGAGTIEWAGGLVNWNMPEFQDPGYLYVTIKDIEIQCYDPPKGIKQTGFKSYKLNSLEVREQNVEISNQQHILASPEAVGFDMKRGDGGAKSFNNIPNNGVIGKGRGGGSISTNSGSKNGKNNEFDSIDDDIDDFIVGKSKKPNCSSKMVVSLHSLYSFLVFVTMLLMMVL